MDNIDVRGLPEPFAEALAAMVERFRQQFTPAVADRSQFEVRLSVKPGKVLASLRREDFYGRCD